MTDALTPDALCQQIPMARFMGLTAARDGETVAVTMPFIERVGGNMSVPAIHGGALGTLMETAALLTGMCLTEGTRPRTINITVDYLRPALLEETVATCVVLRHGRRILTVQVQATQGERLVAAAKIHMMIS